MSARLPNHELRELARRRAGWKWERLAGGHVRWRHPNAQSIITSATSSDWRAGRNARLELRRALERSVRP